MKMLHIMKGGLFWGGAIILLCQCIWILAW